MITLPTDIRDTLERLYAAEREDDRETVAEALDGLNARLLEAPQFRAAVADWLRAASAKVAAEAAELRAYRDRKFPHGRPQ